MEDLFEKNILFVFSDKESSTDLTSDTEKPSIALISLNFNIKIFENALYIVMKNDISIYFKDLREVYIF